MSDLSKWDRRWLELAQHVSSWSKDPSTKVGAVIAQGKQLVSLGFNGFPASCEDKPEWLTDRQTKYKLVVHAEINAVLNSQLPVKGSTVYLYPLAPCPTCAIFLARAGVERVVADFQPEASKSPIYTDFLEETEFVFNKNGIQFEVYRNLS
jgi:dCMP deaminase